MPRVDLYTNKAENYALHRWEYAAEALDAIFSAAGVGPLTTVADIGAGPGNLSKHFFGKAGAVYLVEPDTAMRQAAETRFGDHSACRILAGRAEATGLPGASIDLLAIGQAIHYFEAEPAREEFNRILKPGGWLAVLRNYGTNETLNAAIEEVYTEENGCDPDVIASRPAWKPIDFYYGAGNFRRLTFPFMDMKTRAGYIRALATASYAPNESHTLYPRFQAAAGAVFDAFSQDGILETPAETELFLGQMA